MGLGPRDRPSSRNGAEPHSSKKEGWGRAGPPFRIIPTLAAPPFALFKGRVSDSFRYNVPWRLSDNQVLPELIELGIETSKQQKAGLL
jgi:hypothetical protein